MYTVSRSTRSASTAAVELRALVGQAVPEVVAKALTFTVQKAQTSIAEEMSRVFKGGATPYTVKSTRIETATPQDLSARVAVKDRTTNNGTLPEDYLFPQVFGGPRKEKRFERAMRYAGLLKPGSRVVLGDSAPIDTFGNLKRGEMQRILTATRSAFDPYQRKSKSARSRKNAKNAPYFVGGLDDVRYEGGEMVVKKGRMQPGIYRREGRGIKPILIFITKQPTYAKRLDFEGIARATAAREFEPTFRRLLAAANR